MNKTVSAILGFVAGAAVGAGVTYVVLERKFQSEVAEVREVYREMAADKEIEPEIAEEITNEVAKPELSTLAKTYKASSEKEGEYTNYNNLVEEIAENLFGDEDEESIYIIEPSEFGEIEDYDTESLTWYSDHVLVADSNGEVIKDVDSMFPFEFLTHIGDYEDDSVHVRNDDLHVYYEVTSVDEPYKKPKKKLTKKSEVNITMSSDE